MTRHLRIPLVLLAASTLAACGSETTPEPAQGSAGGEMTDEEAEELARRHPVATPEPRPALPEQSPPPPGRGEPPPGPPPHDRGTPPPLPPAAAPEANAPTSLDPAEQPAAAKSQPLVVEGPPPSRPQVGRPPQPHYEYVWVPGYWYWYGGHHVWVAGGWLAPRPGYHYVGAHWVHHRRGWVFIAGGWAPLGASSVTIVHWPLHRRGHWYSHRARHYDHRGYRRHSSSRRGDRGVRRGPRARRSRAPARVRGRSRRSGVRVGKRKRFR